MVLFKHLLIACNLQNSRDRQQKPGFVSKFFLYLKRQTLACLMISLLPPQFPIFSIIHRILSLTRSTQYKGHRYRSSNFRSQWFLAGKLLQLWKHKCIFKDLRASCCFCMFVSFPDLTLRNAIPPVEGGKFQYPSFWRITVSAINLWIQL